MYLSWMPQNIQKRVFLYILHQLSLFSGIELPNLEQVSFNNIHLRDVSLDPDKITKIPGFKLRHGVISDLTFTGSVKEGARLDAAGLDLVLAPSIDNLKQDLENAQALLAQSSADLTLTILLDSPTALDDSVAFGHESPLESAAASVGIDRASILHSEEENDRVKSSESHHVTPTESSMPKSTTSVRKPSFSDGVMSRAIDLALLKLQVRVTNVTVKIVIEPVDLFLEIDELVFSYKSGLKLLRIKGVRVSTGKPIAGATGRQANGSALEKAATSDSGASDDESSSQSDDDLDPEEPGAASLMDSMVFTHEEASSIYMSANADSFAHSDEKDLSATNDYAKAAPLLYVDTIDLLFQNVSPLSHLSVDISTIKVAAVPLLPALSVLLNSFSKLFKLATHQLRKRNSLRKHPSKEETLNAVRTASENELQNTSVLERFHVSELEISLTSALDSSGEFASTENEVSLLLRNFSMKVKEAALTYGGMESFQILRYIKSIQSSIFEFSPRGPHHGESVNSKDESSNVPDSSSSSKRADVRFELCEVSSRNAETVSKLTVLISKPGYLKLDASSLKHFINFFRWLSTVKDSFTLLLSIAAQFNEISSPYKNLSLSNSDKGGHSHRVILESASFEAELQITSTRNLRVHILPLSYDEAQGCLTIPKIKLGVSSAGVFKHLATIDEIKVDHTRSKAQTFLYSNSNQSPRKTTIRSSIAVTAGEVDCRLSYLELLLYLDDMKSFNEMFKLADDINSADIALSPTLNAQKATFNPISNLMTSVYTSQSRVKRTPPKIAFGENQSTSLASFFGVKLMKVTLAEITDDFGGLEMVILGFEATKTDNDLSGCFSSLVICRDCEPTELLLTRIPGSITGIPAFQFLQKRKSSLDFEVVCRGLMIEYHTKWLDLLSGRKTRELASSDQDPHDSSPGGLVAHVRVLYHDLAIGMLPGRLQSKMIIAGLSGNLDLDLDTKTLSIKSTIRDLKIFLIDDLRSIRTIPNESKSSPFTRFVEAGYVSVGNISHAHTGLILGLSSGSSKLLKPATEESTTKACLKLNVDNLSVDICSDSAHTLLQTISDLKQPVIFNDEDKFRVRVDKAFRLPEEIVRQIDLREESKTAKSDFTGLNETVNNQRAENILQTIDFIDGFYGEERSPEEVISTDLNNVGLDESSNSTTNEQSIKIVDNHFVDNQTIHSITGLSFLLKMNIKRVEIYLHDGYDWKSTRKAIKKAVKSLEHGAAKPQERRSSDFTPPKDHSTTDIHTPDIDALEDTDIPEDKAKTVQTLFQSIHIQTDQNIEASNLVEIINAQVGGANACEDVVDEAHLNVKVDKAYKGLKLRRSRSHKVLIVCDGIVVNVENFPNDVSVLENELRNLDYQVVNRVNFSLDTVDVEDNVQSSTWNRLLTYMNAIGERETGSNMFSLDVTNVRPDPQMAYTEAIILLKVLPLRLFIDQDTLAFLCRFIGFRDSRFALPIDELLYVQKLSIEPLRVRFDYKPKAIDYAGIRSGNNAELANLFILDGSDLHLKKAVVYGAHGFPKLGKMLGQIYGPYIQKHQIAGLLSGLSPFKAILNVGSGVKDLVKLPVQQYKKDGRVLYGLQKGSVSFAKSTTSEILRLGVKLASGAQVVLENLEEYLGGEGALARRPKPKKTQKLGGSKARPKDLLESSQILRSSVMVEPDQFVKPVQYNHSTIDEEDLDTELEQLQSSMLVLGDFSEHEDESVLSSDEEEHKLISLYSNQPANAKDGLKSAYRAMGNNLKGSRRKFSELKRELKSADTFKEQIVSVAKSSPVIVIRPMIGGTEALMKTLIGISNGIDSRRLQESRDKYRTDSG